MTTTATQNDITAVPTQLLNDFSDNFNKLKNVYELIDHTIADRQTKQDETKSFSNANDLFDDLDN